MRQKFGFFQHDPASVVQVTQGALVPLSGQELFHLRVDCLRLIAEAEEHFSATQKLSLTYDSKHFVDGHGFRAGLIRRLAESTIAAKIATKVRERDKDLRRKRNDLSLRTVAHLGSRSQQRFQLIALRIRQRQGFSLP